MTNLVELRDKLEKTEFITSVKRTIDPLTFQPQMEFIGNFKFELAQDLRSLYSEEEAEKVIGEMLLKELFNKIKSEMILSFQKELNK